MITINEYLLRLEKRSKK